MLYTIAAALAEWERNTTVVRTMEGLEAARQRGVKLGRPLKMTDEDIKMAEEWLLKTNNNYKEVAILVGVDPRALRRTIRMAA